MLKNLIFSKIRISNFFVYVYLKRKIFNYFINRNLSRIEKLNLNLSSIGKKILFASSIGGNGTSLGLETFLGKTLSNQSIETRFILCDKFLPACFECTYINKPLIKDRFISNQDANFCKGCFSSGKRTLIRSNLNFSVFSDYMSNDEKLKIEILADDLSFEALKTYSIDEVAVGMHAVSGALRYLTKSELTYTPENHSILRSFFIAAEISRVVFTRLLNEFRPDIVVAIHGLYVPQGVIVDVCKSKKILLKVWNVAYRDKTFLVSKNDTYHQTLLHESNKDWIGMHLTEVKKDQILNYLNSRSDGSADWLSFSHSNSNREVDQEVQTLLYEYGFENTICLLTNVAWDAKVHYKQNLFTDMDEWLYSTIDWFIQHPKYLLLIRVHPGEVTNMYPSIELTSTKIEKKYKSLPKNIIMFKSEDKINTYEVCRVSSKVLIYATKMGVELAPLEKPIIVAGEAWIKNKGLTYDPVSKDAYFELLGNLDRLTTPPTFTKDNAFKYAYHFFFEKMIDSYGIKTVLNPSCIVSNPKSKNINKLSSFFNKFLEP